jgi:hypothetical protein
MFCSNCRWLGDPSPRCVVFERYHFLKQLVDQCVARATRNIVMSSRVIRDDIPSRRCRERAPCVEATAQRRCVSRCACDHGPQSVSRIRPGTVSGAMRRQGAGVFGGRCGRRELALRAENPAAQARATIKFPKLAEIGIDSGGSVGETKRYPGAPQPTRGVLRELAQVNVHTGSCLYPAPRAHHPAAGRPPFVTVVARLRKPGSRAQPLESRCLPTWRWRAPERW